MTLRDRLPSRRVLLLAAVGAVLLFVAYPPAGLLVPSFVALVPLLWALEEARAADQPAGRVAWTGWWFGVLSGGLLLYWMVVALWHFTPLSALGWSAAVLLGFAPLWALIAWLTYRIGVRTTVPLWVSFPLVWTAVEWLLGHLADLRFPWLGLGTSLTRAPLLVQWADVAGARGVTLWLAWANVMAFLALRRRDWRPAAAVAATIALAAGYGAWRTRTLVVRPVAAVALLQPNVGFDEKREDRENIRLLNQLLAMSRQAARDTSVRLIAWPEAAVPVYFVNHPDYADSIAALARELAIPVLAGGVDAVIHPDGSYDNWNAAFFVDARGRFADTVYHKRYLVPIVERVPFVNPDWFGDLRWFGGFEAGSALPVYRIPEGAFGVVICYESAFEDLARHYRREGADFLLNITNDAWFGRTAAPYQHAAHLVMRAIETRMGIARAANSGISEFVDPLGRPYQVTDLLTERVVADVVRTTDVRTLYVRLGDWVAVVALVGTLACLAATVLRRPTPGAAA